MEVDENIIVHLCTGRSIDGQDAPAGVAGINDGVVYNIGINRRFGPILLKERDAGRMILVKQVIVDQCTLYTIEIDPCSPAQAIFPDDITINLRISTDPISSLAGICIDLDATAFVVMAFIISNDGAVAD